MNLGAKKNNQHTGSQAHEKMVWQPITLCKSIFKWKESGFNKWQWWGSYRKSLESIFSQSLPSGLGLSWSNTELGLNKCKAMKDFAVFYLIFIPVIYLFFKHLDWSNPLIQHCLLNAYFTTDTRSALRFLELSRYYLIKNVRVLKTKKIILIYMFVAKISSAPDDQDPHPYAKQDG